MNDVTPLVGEEVADIHAAAFEPTLAQKEQRRAAEAEEQENVNFLSTEYVELVEPEECIEFRRDGVQEGVYKRLNKTVTPWKRVSICTSIRYARRTAVFNFIQDCHNAGVRTALIIHGQGKHSKPHPALIKSYVNKWLREMPPVLAFRAHQRLRGGRGAVYIMMKKNAEQKQKNREKHAKKITVKRVVVRDDHSVLIPQKSQLDLHQAQALTPNNLR